MEKGDYVKQKRGYLKYKQNMWKAERLFKKERRKGNKKTT